MTSNRRRCQHPRSAKGTFQSGQSLVEFAIVLPLLLLLLIGVIELGRYAYLAILVGNAARAGAAYGAQSPFTAGNPIVGGTPAITIAADNDFQSNGQPVSNLVITTAFVCSCDNAGTMSPIDCTTGICPVGTNKVSSLQVTAQGTFSSLFSFPGLPASMVITRSAIMRIGT
jgi:Flp pilus assembly protein TadG